MSSTNPSVKVRSGAVRLFHEILFSLNLSLSFTAFVLYGLGAWFAGDISKVQFATPSFLHNGAPDFVTIYWFLFPILAICFWLSLRLFCQLRFTRVTLRFSAGVVAIAAAPFWFLARYDVSNLKNAWTLFQDAGFYEVIVALVCLVLYLKGKWSVPGWGGLLLLAGHYCFWLWEFRGYLRGYWVGLGGSLNYALQERNWLTRSLEICRIIIANGWSDLVAVTALMAVVGILSGFAWAFYASEESGLSRTERPVRGEV